MSREEGVRHVHVSERDGCVVCAHALRGCDACVHACGSRTIVEARLNIRKRRPEARRQRVVRIDKVVDLVGVDV